MENIHADVKMKRVKKKFRNESKRSSALSKVLSIERGWRSFSTDALQAFLSIPSFLL